MPFQKGNKVGGGKKGRSGRPSKAEELGLAALLNECWTEAQRKACITALAEKAKAGEMEAVKLLLAYTYGKPREQSTVLEFTAEDLDSLNDYELERFIAGDDPRSLFAAARRRRAAEKAKTG